MFELILQLHKKGGGSNTTVQSYQPTAEERKLMGLSADYAEYVMPNAQKLNDSAANLFFQSLGDTQVDYKTLLEQAQQQTQAAQQGVADLTQGKLPDGYVQNMTDAISSGVENTMGNALSSLSGRGVLSSSVTNQAMNDISKNVSDTMAQQYLNNISTLNGLYGQQATLAGQNIANSAAAQEAAQNPAINAWNMSLGLGGASNSALSAIGNKGTTTSTQSTSGGGGLFGGILTGLAGNAGLFGTACFSEDTKVKTPDGEKYIRHIKPGDKVMAYSEDGDDKETEVYDALVPVYSDVYVVVCDAAKGKKNYVSTTLTQPLLTADGDYKEVSMLRIGTELKNAGRVRGIVYSGERKVYDLKLASGEAYYANGFVAKGATDEW
jgi:hypothetical protein